MLKRTIDFTDKYAYWIFPLPAALAILLLVLGPVVTNVVLSMHDWFISGRPEFVGLQNYVDLFNDRRFWNGVKNTFLFTGLSVPIELVLGVGVAVLFNRAFIGRGIARTILILPMAATPVAVSLIWFQMFNPSSGILNYFLEAMGLPRLLWLASPQTAMPSLVLVDVWQWTPMIALIVLAALQNVPQEHYEAAEIDGANGWQRFWYISLPSIRASIVVALILRSLDSLKTFDKIFVMTEGGPGIATETLNVYVYKTAFVFFRAGYGSALVLMLMVLVLSVAIVLNRFRVQS